MRRNSAHFFVQYLAEICPNPVSLVAYTSNFFPDSNSPLNFAPETVQPLSSAPV